MDDFLQFVNGNSQPQDEAEEVGDPENNEAILDNTTEVIDENVAEEEIIFITTTQQSDIDIELTEANFDVEATTELVDTDTDTDSTTPTIDDGETTTQAKDITEELDTSTTDIPTYEEATTIEDEEQPDLTTQSDEAETTTEVADIQDDDYEPVDELITTEPTPAATSTTTNPSSDLTTTEAVEEVEGSSENEEEITFPEPDPTMDYVFVEAQSTNNIVEEVQISNNEIVFEDETIDSVPLIELINDPAEALYEDYVDDSENEIFDDDIESYDVSLEEYYEEEEDNVVVVTSKPMTEDEDDEDNDENVVVVTGETVTAKTWDELQVIEEILEYEDEYPETTELTEEVQSTSEQITTENFINLMKEDELQTVSSVEEEELLETVTEEVEYETMEPSIETIQISQQDNIPATNKQEDIPIVDMYEATTEVDIPEVDEVTETMTDFTTTEAVTDDITTTENIEIQFDDHEEYDYDYEIISNLPQIKKIIDVTTTGSPVAAVKSETEKIYYETTTGSIRTSSSYFPVQAVESETEEDKIFDETTTGTPLIKPLAIEASEFDPEEDTEGSEDTEDSKDSVDYDADDIPSFEAVVADTTTGTPLSKPLIEAVIAQEDEEEEYSADETDDSPVEYDTDIPEIQAVFAETTTGASNSNVDTKSVDLDQTTSSEDVFTPAFTTAPVTDQSNEEEHDSSKIFFPEDIEDMVAKFASKMSQETTTNAIMDDDIEEYDDDEVVSTTQQSDDAYAESSDNKIVKVDMYAEEDDTTTARMVAAALVAEEVTTKDEEVTTMINGFVINKNADSIIDNSLETVRTGGVPEEGMMTTEDVTDETTVAVTAETTDFTTEVLAVTTEITNDETTEEIPADEIEEDEVILKAESRIAVTEDATTVIVAENIERELTTLNEIPETTVSLLSEETTSVDFTEEDIEGSTTTTGESITEPITTASQDEEQDSKTEEEGKKPAPFPVTDLLKGIYKLIQGYIPSQDESDPEPGEVERNDAPQQQLEYFDSPQTKPISNNVHNTPREPLTFNTPPRPANLEDPIDVFNSNTDPFKQLSAPDLTKDKATVVDDDDEREESLQLVYPTEIRKSNLPITPSPFDSPALIVKEPPKDLTEEAQERVDDDESSFSSFIQKPFQAFLPSFLTNSNKKQKPKVAGSLPVTVKEQTGQNVARRPSVSNTPSKLPFLGSLFNNRVETSKKPDQRRRPLRPDVPAQTSFGNSNGFLPSLPARQRSSPVSIPLPGTVDENIAEVRSGRFVRQAAEEPLQEKLLRFIKLYDNLAY